MITVREEASCLPGPWCPMSQEGSGAGDADHPSGTAGAAERG